MITQYTHWSPCQHIKVKVHTYIAPLEAQFYPFLISGILHITSPAGLLHPTFVWRFQEAASIPMQGGALTCLPSNAVALLVLIYTWVGWSLVNLKQGSAQPKPAQFWLWSVSNLQPLKHELKTAYTFGVYVQHTCCVNASICIQWIHSTKCQHIFCGFKWPLNFAKASFEVRWKLLSDTFWAATAKELLIYIVYMCTCIYKSV